MRKLIQWVFAIVGAFVGYAVYNILRFVLSLAGVQISDFVSTSMEQVLLVVFAIIFAFIFYVAVPSFERGGTRLANNMNRDLQNVSGGQILAGSIGLIMGLIVATLITQLLTIIQNTYLYTAIVILVYAFFSFLGIVIAVSKGPEIYTGISNLRKEPLVPAQPKAARGAKKKQGIPKVLDTSVIIDGRIADIMRTGFLEGQIIIPDFVLVELRHIADSADGLKRARGRQGLDILNEIREDFGVEIYNTDNDKSLKNVPEVDVKLLKLAQNIGGKVVTNDYNLNKVAGINGVSVLNINELANTLKPIVLPGERMTVHLVRKGSNVDQAVAYLNDGTMVVVEDGYEKLGETVEITVTSALQTAAGRMIFGRLVRD